MAIYLDNKGNEQQVVIRALKKDKTIAPWVLKSLVERLEYDKENANKRDACTHTNMQEYEGEKLRCDDCLGYGDNGYFRWKRKNE